MKNLFEDCINVGLKERSYDILMGCGNLATLPGKMAESGLSGKVGLITNADLVSLYGEAVRESLCQAGMDVSLIVIPEGEDHKNLKTLESIYDQLIQQRFDRSCVLIALGGGVVGDTVGFAAATFLRGVPFIQVPTTLLSQVDSSVGGKTAVNHPLGKNLIGAFYQPKLVLIDIETLKTLDRRELSAGLAEVVKYGVIRDSEFFTWLEMNAEKLLNLDEECLLHAIRTSCQIKADIVEADEKEQSIRAILNYGHTFGHAIEALSGYGQWRHGEAVAAGMVVAAKISQAHGLCRQEEVERIRELLERMRLPTVPPAFPLDDYVNAMKRDKKISSGTLTMVLNCGIGEARLERIVDIESVFAPIIRNREA